MRIWTHSGAWRWAVLFVGLMLATSGCSTLTNSVESPTLSLSNVTMLQSNLLEQRYRLTLRVQNPNGIGLPVKGMNYAVKFAGIDFASGVTPNSFRIPANGEHLVDIDVTTNLLRSAQQLMRYFKDDPDTLDYQLSGSIQVDIPFVGAVPFTKSGTVNFNR
ncbi:MAG: LEA type 2 family protein [Gammaproteobacteria bacterium]